MEDKIKEAIELFDLKNPNNGENLTFETLKSFAGVQGGNLKTTLISLTLMAEANNYLEYGTKDAVKKYLK